MRNARTLLDTNCHLAQGHTCRRLGSLPSARSDFCSIFCGVLYASLFIIYLRIKNAAGASSIPRPRKEDDHKDTCDGTNCQPGAGPQGEMHTARHVFLISAPPLLRRISLISTVCNATAFSQARRVHEHPCSRLFWGQAETTRPTKSGMTGRCHCCRPNCWFIGDVALTKV